MSDQSQETGGQPVQKPGAVTAIGVLNIVFGAISLIASGIVGLVNAFASQAMGALGEFGRALGEIDADAAEGVDMMERALEESGAAGTVRAAFTVGLIFSILQILLNAFLLAAGIMLLKASKSALAANRIYGFAAIALVVIQTIINAAIGLGVGWFGAIIGVVYPVLVLALVVYSKNVQNYLNAQG